MGTLNSCHMVAKLLHGSNIVQIQKNNLVINVRYGNQNNMIFELVQSQSHIATDS